MGCAGSKGEPESQTRSAPAPTSSSATTAQKVAPAAAPKAVKVSAATQYDTESMASYSNNGPGGEGFFGLFANNTSENIKLVEKKSRVNPAVHALNDSAIASTGSDSKDLVLISGIAMTLYYKILVHIPQSRVNEVKDRIKAVFDIVDKIFNNWNPESEISKVSKLQGHKPMNISDDLLKMFNLVKEIHDTTKGKFDPTVASVWEKWRVLLAKNGRPPVEDEISYLSHAIGWQKVKFKGNTVTLDNSNTIIDLCGLSKGYTIDLICKELKGMGLDSMYIDWAGDIRAMGRFSDERPWRTVVMNPPDLTKLFDLWTKDKLENALSKDDGSFLVDVEDFAVATSGDYARIEKFGYHHIFDVQNLTPLRASKESVASVTVIAKTCVIADAVATAAMSCSTLNATRNFLEDLKDRANPVILGYCILNRRGDVFCTDHFKDIRGHQLINQLSENSLPGTAVDESMIEKIVNITPRQAVIAVTYDPMQEKLRCLRVDSLAMCSLDPPLLSFHIGSKSLLDALLTKEGDKFVLYFLGMKEKRFAELSGTDSGFIVNEDAVNNFTEVIQLECKVKDIMHDKSLDDKMSVCIAEPEKIEIPVDRPRLYNFQNAFYEFPQTIQTAKSKSIKDNLKMVLRGSPLSVCLITIQCAGEKYAMTASSVRCSLDTLGFYSFNIQKNSSFRELIRGQVGTYVAIHFLSTANVALAEKYSKSIFIKEDRGLLLETEPDVPPIFKGISCVLCPIRKVSQSGDHEICVVEVKKVIWRKEGQDYSEDLLIRSGQTYTKLLL